MSKKNKGFTLVELLAVIILLSLLMLLVFPKIVNTIKNSSKDTDKLSEQLIYNATKLYVEKYKNNYPKNDGNVYCVAVKDLVDEKYLTGPVTFSDGEDISNTKTVEVSYTGGFEYSLKDNTECVELKKVIYIDASGAIVELPPGLKPVVYNNNNWLVADTDSEWSNYNNQEWANAVLLKEGVSKNTGDIVNVESEVQAMFVYIPRYEYKIEGEFGTHPDGAAGTWKQPGEVEVNFISKEITSASEGYHMHPAFNFGGTELNGIWVGKFKITGDSETPTILPNVQILTNKSRAEYFEMAKRYNNRIKNIDSHVIKNVEWSSFFYLSQSKYGKYGNNIYTGDNKGIYIKSTNIDDLISGKNTGEIDSRGNANKCLYDDITDRGSGTGSCGGGASTTGNITGIYDVNGAPYEFVMGVANNTIDKSGFTELPDSKYYDNYVVSDKETTCDGAICYGHGLSEIAKWYTDYNGFDNVGGTVWILRGDFIVLGYNGDVTNLAHANKCLQDGAASLIASSRIVITAS